MKLKMQAIVKLKEKLKARIEVKMEVRIRVRVRSYAQGTGASVRVCVGLGKIRCGVKGLGKHPLEKNPLRRCCVG